MSLASHQERVVEERRALDEKLTALHSFRTLPKFAGLSLVDQGLLVEQAAHMEAYLGVLDARIKRFAEAGDEAER